MRVERMRAEKTRRMDLQPRPLACSASKIFPMTRVPDELPANMIPLASACRVLRNHLRVIALRRSLNLEPGSSTDRFSWHGIELRNSLIGRSLASHVGLDTGLRKIDCTCTFLDLIARASKMQMRLQPCD